MRVTADLDDPDFIGEANYGRFKVEIDGKRIENPFEADDEAGYVLLHARDEDGGFVINEEQTETVKVTLRGNVRIIDTRQAA